MPLVTVKPKFQVTIPAKLRKGLDLREGDVMEMSVVADGILLRPKDALNRDAVVHQVAAVLERVEPPPEDAGRSEDDVMEDIVTDIAAAREERRRDV